MQMAHYKNEGKVFLDIVEQIMCRVAWSSDEFLCKRLWRNNK